MRVFGIAALSALGLLYAGEAQALTISNLDAKPHTVTVTAGSELQAGHHRGGERR